MNERLIPESALAKLKEATGKEFITLFRPGTLEVEVYKPGMIDRQKPHTRDEIYVVISGSGYVVNGPDRNRFQPGEVSVR